MTAPGRFVHAPTWLTALCSVVRAAALEVSSELRAAACSEARTGPGADDAGRTDGEEGAGVFAAEAFADVAGAFRVGFEAAWSLGVAQ